jgi:hypothetical protein
MVVIINVRTLESLKVNASVHTCGINLHLDHHFSSFGRTIYTTTFSEGEDQFENV